MKIIHFMLLLAGILFFDLSQSARADVLDKWTTNQITTNSFGMHHVVYGNGVFVAVGEKGDGGGIYSSADGLNWTLRYSDNNAWGLTMAYSGGRFVGAGGWEYAFSTDGTNWTVLFLPQQSTSYPYSDMTYGNGRYVEVGNFNGTGTISTSTDGTNWTQRTAAAMGGPIVTVTYGTKFVAVGNNDGYEYTASSTAVTWTRSSIPGGSQVSYGNGLYFVPLNAKTNLISTDGINWSLKSTGLTNQLGTVIYGNGHFIAQCGYPSSVLYLATSIDGTNWFEYPQPLPNRWGFYTGGGPYYASLASDGTRLIAVGSTNNPTFFYGDGFIFDSGVLVATRMTNNPSRNVVLSGLVGRNYQIQSVDGLSAVNNWRTNTTLQLTSTPYLWTDSTATNSARFYRGVLLP